jgi:hypothetical protein
MSAFPDIDSLRLEEDLERGSIGDYLPAPKMTGIRNLIFHALYMRRLTHHIGGSTIVILFEKGRVEWVKVDYKKAYCDMDN